MFEEILPDIYKWSEFSEEKQLDFNGYLVKGVEESVIIDPPDIGPEGLISLADLVSSCPLKGILLSNAHHERASDSLKNELSIPVWVNELDSDGLEGQADSTFKGGDVLQCGIEAIQLDDQKSPGETAFFVKDRKIMIVGDAILGKVPGKLNMLPPDKYKDPAKAKAGLKKLLNYEFDTLLVGDGVSILKNAKQLVAGFIAS